MFEAKNVTWNVGMRNERRIAWEQIQELSREGWEIKSSHAFLAEGDAFVTVLLQKEVKT
jgi:hypothetical protein